MDWSAWNFTALADVTHTRDGDTIEVVYSDGTTEAIRWPAHNTPETGMPFGAEAKARLVQLLASAKNRVMCASFEEVTGLSGGRTRRHPLFEDPTKRGRWINAAVILGSEGLTYPFPSKDQWSFNKAVNRACLDAMSRKVGLWAEPDPDFKVVGFYNPSGADAGLEYIEVTNVGTKDRPLGGWSVRLSDAWGPQQRGFVLPETAHILPGKTARVSIKPGTDTHDEWFWDYGAGVLVQPMNNRNEETGNGDMVALLRPSGVPAAWDTWLPV